MVIPAADKLMIDGCIAGKRDAQYTLYQKYCKGMFSLCLRMVNDYYEAEDVLQNAFVDIFTKLKMFRYESTPGAWIKKIVVHHCINHLRSKKNIVVSAEQFDDRPDNHTDDYVEFDVTFIKNAISQLPDGYRSIFCLYAMEGYDHSEIAEILEISESTSKSQYSRARTKIYELLKNDGSINKIFQ